MTSSVFDLVQQGDPQALRDALAGDPSLAGSRNEHGVSLLMIALYHRQAEAAQAICAALPALDLFEAAATGEAAQIDALLAERPGGVSARSGDGFTALHLAAFFGQTDASRVLLRHGADVSAVAANPSQVQPLHSAVAARSDAVAALLLEAGADSNARQAGGWTPLMAAAKHGQRDLVARLLAHDADPAQAADDGQTALDLAADEETRALLRA